MLQTVSTRKPGLFWVLILCLAVFFAQGIKLHLHNFDHQHNVPSQHEDVFESGHSHVDDIHLANDLSHMDHHGGAVSEVDISADGLLKKVSSNISLLFVLLLFCLLLPGFARKTQSSYFYRSVTLPWRYLCSPPLRAPPLL